MSTCSSALFVFNFYYYVVLKSELPLYDAIGIIAIFFLTIGNIVYFISAYYAYGLFKIKFFEKIGAKQILHGNFK